MKLYISLELGDDLSLKYGQAFKTIHNATKGFHLQVMIAPGTTANDLPNEFEMVGSKLYLLI